MSRAYIPAAQAQAYYAARAADYARRGFPKIAESYRWMAANAADIAVRIDRAALSPQETTR